MFKSTFHKYFFPPAISPLVMSNPVSWFHHERQKVGVHKQMCLYGLPEVEALSVGKNRKGSTQRPLSTDEHDSETQTKTHISGYRVLTSVQLNYFSPSEAFCWLNTHKNRQSFKMKTLTLHLCGEMKIKLNPRVNLRIESLKDHIAPQHGVIFTHR